MTDQELLILKRRVSRNLPNEISRIYRNHFSHALDLLKYGTSDNRFYYSVLLHINCIFDGGLQEIAIKENIPPSNRKSLFDIINSLKQNGSITDSIADQLHHYRIERNKSVHQMISSTISKEQAVATIAEGYLILTLIIELFKLPSGRKISDYEFTRLIITNFCKSFEIYCYLYRLYWKEVYIAKVSDKEIKNLLKHFYEQTLTTNFFSMQQKRKNSPTFEINFKKMNSVPQKTWRLRTISFTDYPREDPYRKCKIIAGDYRFYIFFCFTNRKRVDRFLQDFKKRKIPFIVINPLKYQGLRRLDNLFSRRK